MSRLVSIAIISGACGLLLFTHTGCMKCGEDIAERALERAVEQATGGQVDIGRGTAVDVSDLPGFLRYPGAKPTGRFSVTESGVTGTTYAFESGDDAGKVVSWFQSSANSQGWKEVMKMDTGEGAVLNLMSPDEKSNATVGVSIESDKTTIVVLYSRPSGN